MNAGRPLTILAAINNNAINSAEKWQPMKISQVVAWKLGLFHLRVLEVFRENQLLPYQNSWSAHTRNFRINTSKCHRQAPVTDYSEEGRNVSASWGSVQRLLQSPVSTRSSSCYLWTCVSCRPHCQFFGLVSWVTLFWVPICHLMGWLLKNIVFWKLSIETSWMFPQFPPPPSLSLSFSLRQMWIQHDYVLAQGAAVAVSDNSTKVDWP